MIDLFYAATPGGQKITLFLEEAELARRLIRVDISKGVHYSIGHRLMTTSGSESYWIMTRR
jgi:glutathione S-transferase